MANFGTTSAGETVEKITLAAGDLQVCLLTWGAVLQSVRLKGVDYDLTLGSENIADYQGAMGYYGALVAPVVNRLTDARAKLGDGEIAVEVNFNGRHSLHSGPSGAQHHNWRIKSQSASAVVLELDLPDGLGGFPGNRHLEARFEVSAPASLRMTVTCESDAETLFNCANHSYWNLDGSGSLTGHQLQIAAEDYLPVNADFVPTGEIRPVSGMFDFRKPQAIFPHKPDLDNCYCLSRAVGPLRDVLWLTGQSGLRLTLATTEPGVQVYDCRHDGFKGLAIEAQGWPDAPNKPDFPPISLAAGATRTQVTEWRFDRG
jgi:aldose 1-epimerase